MGPMTPYLFSFLFPLLLLMAALQHTSALIRLPSKGVFPTLVIAIMSALIICIPVSGLPPARWLISLNANFSIPLTLLLLSHVLKFAFAVHLLDRKARHACGLFAILAGAGLYPMALGFTRFDPYGAGWGFSWLFVVTLLLTMGLITLGNRFGVVLLIAILAYNLRVLESSNFWDYLVDPVLVIWALIHAIRTPFRKRNTSPPAPSGQ
ncbi:MAG: hypothetical protein U5R49_15975 [Deltaproteobacteria bacterium]|nr:hypothetical protein [Deltaproteobacteria bacterium]